MAARGRKAAPERGSSWWAGGKGNFLSWHVRAYNHWLSLWTNHQVSDGKTLGLTFTINAWRHTRSRWHTRDYDKVIGVYLLFCVRAVSFQMEFCDTVQPLNTHEILKQPHKMEKPTARRVKAELGKQTGPPDLRSLPLHF